MHRMIFGAFVDTCSGSLGPDLRPRLVSNYPASPVEPGRVENFTPTSPNGHTKYNTLFILGIWTLFD